MSPLARSRLGFAGTAAGTALTLILYFGVHAATRWCWLALMCTTLCAGVWLDGRKALRTPYGWDPVTYDEWQRAAGRLHEGNLR